MKYQKFGVHCFDLGWQLLRQILTKSKTFQKNKFLSPKQVLCRLLCKERRLEDAGSKINFLITKTMAFPVISNPDYGCFLESLHSQIIVKKIEQWHWFEVSSIILLVYVSHVFTFKFCAVSVSVIQSSKIRIWGEGFFTL